MNSKHQFYFVLFFCATSLFSCRKEPTVSEKKCKLTYLHDDGGIFTNNTMNFEYSTDGRISKIEGNDWTYTFEFHDDSVIINEYDPSSLSRHRTAKLNNAGLIEWEKDSSLSLYFQSVVTSTYDYDSRGLLLKYRRQGMDTVTYEFTYSNDNAVSASVRFQENGNDDTLVYSYEYFDGTINNLLIIPPDADDIMLSGLYGKISTNLMQKITTSFGYASFDNSYEYDLDNLGNPTKMYEIFMGDTLGNTTFTWDCN